MFLNINPRNPRVLIGILGKFAFSADFDTFPVFFLFFHVFSGFSNREIDFLFKTFILRPNKIVKFMKF